MSLLSLIVGVVGFMSGIICRSFFEYGFATIGFVFLLAALIMGAFVLTRLRFYILLAVLLFAMGAGMVRMQVTPSHAPEVFTALLNTPVSLVGTISADPDIRETSARITVDVQKDGVTTRVLAVSPLYPHHSYGEEVQVSGMLTEPEPFATDGGREFRYDTFLAKDGIYFLIQKAEVETRAPPAGFFTKVRALLYSGKTMFSSALARAIPEPYASLASGLIAGGKQGLGKELLDAFTVTGLLPIIVLSGYNVMIVADAVLKGLQFLPKRFAVIAAVLVLIAFLMAVGGGSAALRAGVMACIALFARASGKTYDALRALVIAVVLMLLWNPLLLLNDPGFQFSSAATLGLILASSLFEARLTWIGNSFIREILATTLAAQLFVLPLLLYQTGNLSLVSIPANLLVLPVIPLAMLLSFIAGIVALLVPIQLLALLVGLPAYVLLWYVVSIAHGLALLPVANVLIPAFSFMYVFLMYGVVALICVFLTKKAEAYRDASAALPLPTIISDTTDEPW